jgi:hypothetical protein
MDSHLLPAFAARWIKETSPTPYLRDAVTPNLRKQDTRTAKLLCQGCETRFSQDEGNFAKTIFSPYVTKELDEKGCGRGNIRAFQYDEWLLRFALSLQWRTILTRPNAVYGETSFVVIEETWRQFLLGQRRDSGVWETHMIFLSSLAGAVIPAGLKLGCRVNSYLLGTVDATTISSQDNQKAGIYSKIGPIAFFTPLRPLVLKGNSDSKLHMRGTIKVGQKLRNEWLGQFIFVTRPNEVYRTVSEKQQIRMAKDFLANPERTRETMSFHALEVDFKLERENNT